VAAIFGTIYKMASLKILDYYAQAGPLTYPGKYAAMLKQLPDDIAELTHIAQGLIIHQDMAEPFYGVRLTDERRDKQANIRLLKQLLDALFAINDQPLTQPRPPEQRLAGVCHDFALLLVGILRAKSVPARSRYGFGDYFNPGYYEDHSLCEYWDAREQRWVLVDPQFDEVWRQELHIAHDVLDVPRDHFLVAGDAWQQCRSGDADPAQFGIFKGDMRGLWFIAGDSMRDFASLNKMEMLQWDAWPGMPRPNNTMQDKKRLAFFDELAGLTHDPDHRFDELRSLYEDPAKRLHVPPRVFNAMRRHLETWQQYHIPIDSTCA
jgi:hypothetical protein